MSTIAIGNYHGQTVMLPKENRNRHMQVIGSSGSGKSYFLEHMIRRDIVAGRGVCVIDPHGELYDNIINWMIRSDIRTHQLHLINLSDNEHAVGFNPLCADDRGPMRRVNDMISAFERLWGSQMSDTPRLAKCLRLALYPLAVHKLSLLEADIFTGYGNKTYRTRLLEGLPGTHDGNAVRREWEEFEAYTAQQFRDYFESARTRIFEFISSPSVAPIIGQTENVLNFKKCMNEGHIVLVNLKVDNDVHKKEAQVLGALISSDMYASARQRDPKIASSEPFFAYIDECGDYINEDIAKALDETRKFGLHYILSHQRLGQLRNVSDEVHDAVAVNAQTKVIFRVDEDETAEALSRQLFRTSFELEKPKILLNKPVAVGQEIIELYSSSTSESTVTNWGISQSSSSGESASESVFVPLDGSDVGTTETSAETSSDTISTTESGSESFNFTSGTSQSLKTIYEILPTTVYTIEEQIHIGIVGIRSLPLREAIVKLPGMKPLRMNTIDVDQRKPLGVQFKRFIHHANSKSVYSDKTKSIDKQIKERGHKLRGTSENDFEGYDPDDMFSVPVDDGT